MLPCAHADLRGMGKHAVSPEIPIPLFARCEYSQHKTSPIWVRSRQPSVVYIYMYFYFCTHPVLKLRLNLLIDSRGLFYLAIMFAKYKKYQHFSVFDTASRSPTVKEEDLNLRIQLSKRNWHVSVFVCLLFFFKKKKNYCTTSLSTCNKI